MALTPAFAGLLPHPPIVVPAVGGARVAECRATHDACRELAARLVRSRPARVVLVSPHAPRRREAFGMYGGARLRGDLGRFGAPGAAVDLPADAGARAALAAEARAGGLGLAEIPAGEPLDHGAVVPLGFLAETGWRGPTTVLALPARAELGAHAAFGRALGRALAGLPDRTALVASGDMSHRLRPGAPAGFDPCAGAFDEEVARLVACGRLAELPCVDAELRARAAEDVVESTTIVAAAIGFRARGAAALSYEAPFGVGYLVGVLHDGGPAALPETPVGAGIDALPAVAREVIGARLEDRAPRGLPEPRGPLADRAPVFVTLRGAAGVLRGCMGSSVPLRSDLVQETGDRALAAAFRDPRFAPLAREELPGVWIEVSVLGALERVAGASELDPARYGVVVNGAGGRSAVLLPGLEGVLEVEQQIAICRRKAGLPDGAEVEIHRFAVQKVLEAR